MKKIEFICTAILLAVTACKTSAGNSVTWQPDGHIANNAGIQKQLKITGVYDDLSYEGITYLAGFKIAKDGENYPQLVSIDNSLSNIHYWTFAKIPSDIFVYQHKVQVIDTDGSIYRLEKGAWQLTATTFPADTKVVYSDNNSDLIICYPASPFKSVVRASGCKSLSHNWQLDFIWLIQTPKICTDKLYVIEEHKGSNRLNKVDIKTGKIISSTSLVKHPDDMCKL